MTKIAIIGAGISGLTLANKLDKAFDVTVFEKSRGLGGRIATRRAEPYVFDHGAQYFTAKSKEFTSFLSPLIENDVVAPWQAKIVTIKEDSILPRDRAYPSYVALPGMSALGRAMAVDLNIQQDVEIEKILGDAGNWSLVDKGGKSYSNFDWVAVCAPSPQSSKLLPRNFNALSQVQAASLLPAFTLMLGFKDGLDLAFDGAFVENSSVGFISVNNTKPCRSQETSIVVQSNNKWAKHNVDRDKNEVAEILLKELERLIPIKLSNPDHKVIHRWLYANVDQPVGSSYLLDNENQLAACGDWCIAGRVEAAFESGRSLAENLNQLVAT